MSIQTGDFRLSFERVTASDSIHRVERETHARDFGKKKKEHRQDDDSPDPEFETPEDVVEVAGHDSKDSHIKKEAELTAYANQAANAAIQPVKNPPIVSADSAERRIDIKV